MALAIAAMVPTCSHRNLLCALIEEVMFHSSGDVDLGHSEHSGS